jgi:TPR repeat protein
MPRKQRAGAVALTAVVLGWAAAMSAQAPRETTVYEIVDVGPIAAPVCSCITAPFQVRYRPGSGHWSGAATPLVASAPPINPVHLAEDRANFQRRAEDGLDGNPNASIGVGLHLSLEAALAGMDERMDAEAAKWLNLAAMQGHPDAYRMLGFRYFHGRGVPQSDTGAAYWFHQGAIHGDGVAMVALGLRYASGRGVPQDWTLAARWWERARPRTPLASRFSGDAYACGLGVRQDYASAAAAYKEAAQQGEFSASAQLGSLYANGCAVGSDEAAVQAFERAADQGFPDAQVALSDLVRQGRGVDANPYRAYTLARLAELRLPEGELRTQASAAVASAKRLMNPEAIPSQEALVQDMIKHSRQPIR